MSLSNNAYVDLLAERDRLAAENAELRKDSFPIMGDKSGPSPICIPLSVAEKAYSVYVQRFGKQPLDRIAKRGGFYASEMDDLYPHWRDEVDDIKRLSNALAAANATLDRLREVGIDPSYHGNPADWASEDKLDTLIQFQAILYPPDTTSIRDTAAAHGFDAMPDDLAQRSVDGETNYVRLNPENEA